jgi:hypothetical protein
MRSKRVAVDSFTLSTLFGGLLSGLNGDRSAGAAKVVELSRDPSVLPCNLLNHYVAATVLRALAEVGSASDVDSFWRKCAERLENTREGWPGRCHRILYNLSQTLAGKGRWNRIAQLLQDAPVNSGTGSVHGSNHHRPVTGGSDASTALELR